MCAAAIVRSERYDMARAVERLEDTYLRLTR
jgi:hypothetical protein